MAVAVSDLTLTTWVGSVEMFVTESPWLTRADLPQLKALYSIAEILDSGGKVQAALVSQFTLTQRTLAAKRPGEQTAAETQLDLFLDGEWKPDDAAAAS